MRILRGGFGLSTEKWVYDPKPKVRKEASVSEGNTAPTESRYNKIDRDFPKPPQLMEKIMTKMVRDKKTGRKRRVDPKRSKAAKKAARSRRGKKLSAAVRSKIAKGVKKTRKTGRTKFGRKALTKKAKAKAKAKVK